MTIKASDRERLVANGTTSANAVAWLLTGRPNDGAATQEVPVTSQPFTIGRGSDNSLTIANTTVSGNHAELVLVADDIFVRDLDSTNGTLLNGRAVQGIAGVSDGDILHFGNAMYRVQHQMQQSANATVATDTEQDALGQVQFDKLLNQPAVRPFFQPIVRLADEERIAFEALSRSQLIGLETPDKMFRIAAQRTSSARLSEVCRFEALRIAQLLNDRSYEFYLNTHPAEMETVELLQSLEKLRDSYPDLPMVLEVHESGVTSTRYLRDLNSALKLLNIRLAYDDFGSGQARLMELAEVPPEILKFDISLIKGLAESPQRRSTVASLINIVKDLNVTALAEGVETAEEAEICLEVGFELAQGYLFGRPEAVKHWMPESVKGN